MWGICSCGAKARASAREAAAKEAASKSVSIDLELAGTLHVLADERALQQILLNIIQNAVKFTPAQQAQVDRLLASPHFGERWA